MSAKPINRYKGKVRPFILLTPEEDKALSHAAIDSGLTKSEFMRRALVYCMKNDINIKSLDTLYISRAPDMTPGPLGVNTLTNFTHRSKSFIINRRSVRITN